MKIKKTVNFNNKLIFFKLIQSKILNKKHYLNNIKISEVKYRLKKILFIIFKYHVINKRILFIGTPFNKIEKLKSFSNHIFIPKNIWIRGALSNKKTYLNYLKTNKTITTKFFFKLKKNVDLIVILDNSTELHDILNESYLSRIPSISVNSYLNIHFNKPSYKVPGNFKFYSKQINNVFFLLLLSILKKNDFKKKK